MSEEQRRQLQQQLWKIADDLRGKMNADEFREKLAILLWRRLVTVYM